MNLIDEKYLTEGIRLEAVGQNDNATICMDYKIRINEMIMETVRYDANLIQHIPHRFNSDPRIET
jgi:hypothetical protein